MTGNEPKYEVTASRDAHAELPRDPDIEVTDVPSGSPRPVHLRPGFIAVVFVGGAFGTAAREGIGLLISTADGVPWAVLTANLAGAFLLGVLLEALVRRGADQGVRRMLRLLLGTGFMGGFTTYSALAADTAALFGAGSAGIAAVYAIGTLVIGAVASGAGIVLASAVHRARGGSRGGRCCGAGGAAGVVGAGGGGAAGTEGTAGTAGTAGTEGAARAAGAAGDTGADGAVGDSGAAGAAGAGVAR